MVDDGSADPQIRQRHHGDDAAEQSVDTVIFRPLGSDQCLLYHKCGDQEYRICQKRGHDIDK